MRHALPALFVILALVSVMSAQERKPAPTQAPATAKSSPEIVQQSLRSGQSALEQPQIYISQIVTPQGPIRISPEAMEKLKEKLSERILTSASNTCFTMNSFVFARENGGDAMRLVNHTTCTPASRFKVKRAVVTTPR